MAPTRRNGKICYLEIPTTDIDRSANFYRAVFGWQTRRRGDGATAFDDAVAEVSGAWVMGRPSSPNPGLLLYIMVDSLASPRPLRPSSRTGAASFSRSASMLPN